MSIIWADFPSGQQGLYGSSYADMLNGIWGAWEGNTGNTILVDDPDATIGSAGKVLRATSNTTTLSGARFPLPGGATTTVGVGLRLYMSALPSGNWGTWHGPLIGYRTIANASVCYLTVLSNGAIAVATGSGGTTLLGTTGTPVVTANAWNHIEMKVTRDAAAGVCEVRVNGVTVLNLTGLALGATDTAQIFLGSQAWNFNNLNRGLNYFKDLVIWDNLGSHGNDFQGSVSVRDLATDADVSLNWTPSTGSTGWDILDNVPANDTIYIAAGDPPPSPADFGLTDLPVDVTSVRALLPIARTWKTDGGDCNIQMSLTPNGVDWDAGADRPVTTAPTYWWDVSHVSPDTAAPWTPAEVNNANLRIDRTL